MSIPPEQIANVQLNFAKKNQFCMNEIHLCHRETQFQHNSHSNLANVIFFGEIQFHIGEKLFHESQIEIRSRDLDFHLGKVQFHSGEIDMEEV